MKVSSMKNNLITIDAMLLYRLYHMLRYYYNGGKVNSGVQVDTEDLLNEAKLNLEFKCNIWLDKINDPKIKEPITIQFC